MTEMCNQSLRFYVHPHPRITTSPAPYRPHTHGYPIPHFRDDMTEDFWGSFGSDMLKEQQSEIFISVSAPRDILFHIEDLVNEIARHLRKTQINADQMRNGPGAYFSEMFL